MRVGYQPGKERWVEIKHGKVEEDFLKCECPHICPKIPHINAAQDESRKLT